MQPIRHSRVILLTYFFWEKSIGIGSGPLYFGKCEAMALATPPITENMMEYCAQRLF